MSIERDYDNFVLHFVLLCDVCGEEENEQFDDFYDAVEYKKSEGWKSQRVNGEWLDICPECQ